MKDGTPTGGTDWVVTQPSMLLSIHDRPSSKYTRDRCVIFGADEVVSGAVETKSFVHDGSPWCRSQILMSYTRSEETSCILSVSYIARW